MNRKVIYLLDNMELGLKNLSSISVSHPISTLIYETYDYLEELTPDLENSVHFDLEKYETNKLSNAS